MSLADAYADAHLELATLDADIDRATGMLERAVRRWESMLDVGGAVDVDTSAGTSTVESAARSWQQIIGSITGNIDVDTVAADISVRTAAESWESAASVSGSVDLDTTGASAQLAAAVAVWRQQLDELSGTVAINLVSAPGDTGGGDGGADRVDQISGMTAAYSAMAAEADRVDASFNEATVRLTTMARAARGVNTELAESATTMQQIAGIADQISDALVFGGVFDGGPVTDDIIAASDTWAEYSTIVVTADADTGLADETLLAAAELWDELATVTAVVDMDTGAADATMLEAALLWESLASVTGNVDIDITGASTLLAAAEPEWKSLATVTGNVDIDTTAATAQMTAAAETWRELASITVDLQISDSDIARLATLTTTFDGLTPLLNLPVRFELSNESVAETTAKIAAIVELWNQQTRITPIIDTAVDADQKPLFGTGAVAPKPGRPGQQRVKLGADVDATEAIAEAETLAKVWSALGETIRLKVTVDPVAVAELKARVAAIKQAVGDNVRFVVDVVTAGLAAKAEEAKFLVERTLGRVALLFDFGLAKLARQTADARGVVTGYFRDVGVQIRLDVAAAAASATAAREAIERIVARAVDVSVEVATSAAVATAERLRRELGIILTLGDIAVQLATAKATAAATVLRRQIDTALGGINVGVDFASTRALAAARSLRTAIDAVLQRVGIPITTDFAIAETVAKARAVRAAAERAFGQIKTGIDIATTAAVAKARVAKTLIDRTMGRVALGIDFMTARTLLAARGLKTAISRVLGSVSVDVDINARGVLAKAAAIGASIRSLIGGLFGGGGGDGDGGGGGGFSKLFGLSGGGMAKALPILGKVAGLFAVIAPLIATVIVGIGSLIGTAAGFLTLSAAIGGVALAAGGLGLALNKDLLGGVTDQLKTFKLELATITRPAGEAIAKLLPPFLDVFTRIAASASKITEVFIGPLADSALGWLETFNALLDSPGGQQFAKSMSEGISRLVDTFTEFLPIFLEISNAVSGQFTDALDAVIRMFLQLGVMGKDSFGAFFDLITVLANKFVELGKTALPAFEGLINVVIGLVSSSAFDQLLGYFGVASQLVVQFFEEFGKGFANGEDDIQGLNRFLKVLISTMETAVAIAEPLGYVLNIVGLIISGVYGLGVVIGGGLAGLVTTVVGLFLESIEKILWVGEKVEKLWGGEMFAEAKADISAASDAVWEFGRNGANAFHDTVSGFFDSSQGAAEFSDTAQGASENIKQFGDGMAETQAAADSLAASVDVGTLTLQQLSEQFKVSGQAYADFREAMAKPIELEVKYPDPGEIAKGISDAVTFEDITINPPTSSTTDSVDSFGSPIAEALNQTAQEAADAEPEVKRILTKTFGESMAEAMQKAEDAVHAQDLARAYRAAGEEGLAAMVAGLTGEKLDQFEKEIGDAGSRSAEAFNDQFQQLVLLQTQAEGGGLAGAVDKFVANTQLQLRKLEALKMLDGKGFNLISEQLAALSGPELEAALNEIDVQTRTQGDAWLAALEATMGMTVAAAQQIGRENDPFKAMTDASFANAASRGGAITPDMLAAIGFSEADVADYQRIVGAREAAASAKEVPGTGIKALTPKQADKIGITKQGESLDAVQLGEERVDKFGNVWKYAGGAVGRWVLLRKAEYVGEGSTTIGNLADAAAARNATLTDADITNDDKRWQQLINGTAENVNDLEAALVAAFALSQDTVATSAESQAAAIGTALLENVTSPEQAKVVADNLVQALSTQIVAAVEAASPVLSAAGEAARKTFLDGVIPTVEAPDQKANPLQKIIGLAQDAGKVTEASRPIAAGAQLMVETLMLAIDTAIQANTVAAAAQGMALIQAFIDGAVLYGSTEGVAAMGSTVFTVADTVFTSATLLAPQLMTSGRLMAQSVIDGVREVATSQAAAVGAEFMLLLNQGLGGGAAGGDKNKGALGKIAAAAQAAAPTGPGVTIGYAIGDGIIAGLNAKMPAVIAAVVAAANAVAIAMRAALAIKSPSRVTQTIGEQVATGLAFGITAGQERAVGSATELAGRVAGALTNGVAAAAGTVSDDLAGAIDGISAAKISVSGVADIAANFPTQPQPPLTNGRQDPLLSTQTGLLVAPPASPQTVVVDNQNASAAASPSVSLTIEKLEITGVKDAAAVPAAIMDRTGTELWRLGYGDSPRGRK